MPDFNHILLFVAFISPLAFLMRTARDGKHKRSWHLVCATVIGVAGLCFLLIPGQAGFVSGAVWFTLLFLPAVGARKAAELAAQERYRIARRIAGLVRFLHPSAVMRAEHAILRALELARAGRLQSALEVLDRTADRHAHAEIFHLRGDWSGLLAWSRENVPRGGLGQDAKLLVLYFRALGELGLREELVWQFSGRAPSLLASPIHQPILVASLLTLFAFCGRARAVRQLLKTNFRRMPTAAAAFWIKTSEDAAAANPPLSQASEKVLRRLEGDEGRPLQARARITPAVVIIIGLNLAAFALEIWFGGATNSAVLYQLGALDPLAVFTGQYWRLVSALFLHYGALHLVVNLFALYVLGPALEALVGSWRFALAYLLSGIGSGVGVVALWRFGWTQAELLVGASGAVMGIVGTWAGLLLEHRHLPMARRRLLNLGLIVVIQTAFDFATPQVSMAAHLSGFVSGVLIGLIIAPQRRAA